MHTAAHTLVEKGSGRVMSQHHTAVRSAGTDACATAAADMRMSRRCEKTLLGSTTPMLCMEGAWRMHGGCMENGNGKGGLRPGPLLRIGM